MSAKFEVLCSKKPYGGGFSYFFNTIEEARAKMAEMLCALPPWYDVTLEIVNPDEI